MEFDMGSATTRVLPTRTETGALSSVGPEMTSAREPMPEPAVLSSVRRLLAVLPTVPPRVPVVCSAAEELAAVGGERLLPLLLDGAAAGKLHRACVYLLQKIDHGAEHIEGRGVLEPRS
jgi:hypothetical protein